MSRKNYSKAVFVEGKKFRYNYKYNVVEYINPDEYRDSEGNVLIKKNEVIKTIGLTLESWENKEARTTYLYQWADMIDEECNFLMAQYRAEQRS